MQLWAHILQVLPERKFPPAEKAKMRQDILRMLEPERYLALHNAIEHIGESLKVVDAVAFEIENDVMDSIPTRGTA